MGKTILYIGRFELPDKEATANRVVSNAKLLRDLGHEVVLAGWSSDIDNKYGWEKADCFGFECYQKHKAKTSYEKYIMFTDASHELNLLKSRRFDILIAYDFPAIALKKLMKYCKKNEITCICDVSEWYTNSNKNPLFRMVRAYDSYERMKVLHKKADGLIVISKYLQKYYSTNNTVLIPPLVDMSDEKWIPASISEDHSLKLVYAGWPSRKKERLDLIVDAVSSLYNNIPIVFDIYGIDESQYKAMYDLPNDLPLCKNIIFHGRVTHSETINAVRNADYSIIVRESSLKNNAGFPSKFVESISCGTPVLTTEISNVSDYVDGENNGLIIKIGSLREDLMRAYEKKGNLKVDKQLFDYHRYEQSVNEFLRGCVKK